MEQYDNEARLIRDRIANTPDEARMSRLREELDLKLAEQQQFSEGYRHGPPPVLDFQALPADDATRRLPAPIEEHDDQIRTETS